MAVIKNSLGQCHDILEKLIKLGDTVVDATAGNGYDTAFLSSLVGDCGKVYAFDIQKQALEKTERRLQDLNLTSRVSLINDGHQNMDKYVTEGVRAVVFNLGYLPGGNHSIGTMSDTTIEAIDKALNLILKNGLVCIVVYYGGDSGFDEKNAVMEYIKTIDCKSYTVAKTEFVNQINCPPILVCIEKIK